MTLSNSLSGETCSEAETIIRTATPEKLAALLRDDTVEWDAPELESIRELPMAQAKELNRMMLEGIWIKTSDPRRVFEAVIQPDGAYAFDLDDRYCEMFVEIPFLKKMWKDVASQKQVELMCFALDRGDHEESDDMFDSEQAFYLAVSMLELMELQEGSRSHRQRNILEFAVGSMHPKNDFGLFRAAISDFGTLIAEELIG